MSYIIHTKKYNHHPVHKNKWVCYATLNGYDYYFSGDTRNAARNAMRYILSQQPMKPVEWVPVEYIEFNAPPADAALTPISSQISRIDNSPIA